MSETKGLNVKIKKLHDNAVIPKYAHEFDSGFDLVAVEDVVIEPGETKKVPIGLAFAITQGFELQVRDRSGIATKTKLRVSNAPGTVDSGYRGEVSVSIDNISTYPYNWRQLGIDGKTLLARDGNGQPTFYPDGPYLIRKGDRIAQGVIAPVYQADFEVVDELDETERGAGGFGSSGVKA